MTTALKLHQDQPLRKITGLPQGYEAVALTHLLSQNSRTLVHVTPHEARTAELKRQLATVDPQLEVLTFPAWDCLPYDRASPSADIIAHRLDTLTRLLDLKPNQKACVLVSVQALMQYIAPSSHYQGQSLTIKTGDTLPHTQLIDFLIDKGYQRVETVREPGEFAVRGGIIDLFPTGYKNPLRVDFFGDDVETIRSFDALSQRSLDSCSTIHLKPASEINLTSSLIQQFRCGYRDHFGAKATPVYEAISQGRRSAGMEQYLPLFFTQQTNLLDYISGAQVTLDHQAGEAFQARLEQAETYFTARVTNQDQTVPPLPIENIYWQKDQWQSLQENSVMLTPFVEPENAATWSIGGKQGPEFTGARRKSHDELYTAVAQEIRTQQNQGRKVAIACSSEGTRNRIMTMLAEADSALTLVEDPSFPGHENPQNVSCFIYPLTRGFQVENLLVIGEQDILGDKAFQTKRKTKKTDQFFAEVNDLSSGDLIVHREHGIARYQGLEAVEVGGIAHDCLLLIYEGGDKLFLPVENLDMISRYGNEGTVAQLDKLGSNAWQNRKGKIKKRIREIADYLIKLAAERLLNKAEALNGDEKLYEKFCTRFPYAETEDQLRAISETLQDMDSGKPMDRLVCGDVGFGKTEVALRAAFVAAASGKQVALIVPTTLLCRQHYENFVARFKGFPLRIAQMSRLVKPKETKLIRDELAKGTIDIIIATHTLLSDKNKFKDLGLLIVDEEQHFGVKQKEKLKQLKSNVHVLTLTATPIPRTLQLSLSGVKELSLITTPPIDRLAVQTFVLPFDKVTIREAIMREHFRGGQVFYVCPRIRDLEPIKEKLVELCPDLRIAVAHGQLPTTELEDIMTDFYDGKYDLLLSTNIIESGIDVPTANTLIIHRSDLFGLSQLYQLRGRVGRSKTQGYAYLTLPEEQKVSKTAHKRLEVMQTLDHLGAGFSLASHDLDIRGAGNIVGEEQSGHIREVGIELYQNLLQEAIIMARAEQEFGSEKAQELDEDWSPQINLGTPVMIPAHYVSDLDLRLGLYRRVVNLKTREDIDAFAAELVDRFGALPIEVENLLEIIEIKQFCRQAKIEKLDAGPKGAVITFRNNTFSNPEALISYIQSQTGTVKLRPDQKLVFIRPWLTEKERTKGVKEVSQTLSKIT